MSEWKRLQQIPKQTNKENPGGSEYWRAGIQVMAALRKAAPSQRRSRRRWWQLRQLWLRHPHRPPEPFPVPSFCLSQPHLGSEYPMTPLSLSLLPVYLSAMVFLKQISHLTKEKKTLKMGIHFYKIIWQYKIKKFNDSKLCFKKGKIILAVCKNKLRKHSLTHFWKSKKKIYHSHFIFIFWIILQFPKSLLQCSLSSFLEGRIETDISDYNSTWK